VFPIAVSQMWMSFTIPTFSTCSTKTATNGWIGCEYQPGAGTSDGLRWLRSYQASQAIRLKDGFDL
jgi:hypothetical protein